MEQGLQTSSILSVLKRIHWFHKRCRKSGSRRKEMWIHSPHTWPLVSKGKCAPDRFGRGFDIFRAEQAKSPWGPGLLAFWFGAIRRRERWLSGTGLWFNMFRNTKGALRHLIFGGGEVSPNMWCELCFDYTTLSQESQSVLRVSYVLPFFCVWENTDETLWGLSGKSIIDFRMFGGRCRQRFVEYREPSQKLNGTLVCERACQWFGLLHSF